MTSDTGAGDNVRLLTIPQAAAQLNICRSTFYELIRTRQIRAVKIGRCARIPHTAIAEFIQRLEQKTT